MSRHSQFSFFKICYWKFLQDLIDLSTHQCVHSSFIVIVDVVVVAIVVALTSSLSLSLVLLMMLLILNDVCRLVDEVVVDVVDLK